MRPKLNFAAVMLAALSEPRHRDSPDVSQCR
jgi:hypothetical protein